MVTNADFIRGANQRNLFGLPGYEGYLNVGARGTATNMGDYFRNRAQGGEFDFLDLYRILPQNSQGFSLLAEGGGAPGANDPIGQLTRYTNLFSGLAAQNRGYGQGGRNPGPVAGNLAIMEELRKRIQGLRGLGGGTGSNTTGLNTTPGGGRTPRAAPTAESRAPIRQAPPPEMSAPPPLPVTAPTVEPQLGQPPLPRPPEIPNVTIPTPTRGSATEGLWLSRKSSNPLTRLYEQWASGNPELRRLNNAMDGDFASMLFRG